MNITHINVLARAVGGIFDSAVLAGADVRYAVSIEPGFDPPEDGFTIPEGEAIWEYVRVSFRYSRSLGLYVMQINVSGICTEGVTCLKNMKKQVGAAHKIAARFNEIINEHMDEGKMA